MSDSAIGSIAWLALVIAYVVTVWRMSRVAWGPTETPADRTTGDAHVTSGFDLTISVERGDRRHRAVGAR
jgi:hypothetical protein